MIDYFINEIIKFGSFAELDRYYLRNQIKQIMPRNEKEIVLCDDFELDQVVDCLACDEQGKIDEQAREKLLELLTPPTSVVNAFFAQIYDKDPQRALDNFYKLCLSNQTTTKELQSLTFDNLSNNIEIDDFLIQNESGKNRFIRLNIAGESYGFKYVKKPTLERQGVICSEQQLDNAEVLAVMNHLFNLVDIFPTLTLCYNEFDNATVSHRIYQVTTDKRVRMQNTKIWSYDFADVKIAQVNMEQANIYLESKNLSKLKLAICQIINHLPDNCHYMMNVQKLDDDYVVNIGFYKDKICSYFCEIFEPTSQVNLETFVQEALESE